MRIKEMKLSNFQGIKEHTLSPMCAPVVSIYGDNGTGKTTLYNAFCWLLYDKPSTEEKNYNPQTAGTHHLDYAAEMVIETGSGEVSLKKVIKEVYKSKRGSNEKLFDGYTIDYFLDGVPSKEKEYKEKVQSIIESEDVAKMLTRTDYFLEKIPVGERRRILLDMCGDISDKEIIASDGELNDLPAILAGRKMEDFEKIASADRKAINDELKEIPARIDEAEKSKPAVTRPKDELDAVYQALNGRRQALYSELNAVNAGGDASIRKELADAQAEMAEARAEYLNADDSSVLLGRIEGMEDEAEKHRVEASKLDFDIRKKEHELERMSETRERLLEAYKDWSEKKWAGNTICPVCGQNLPEEMIGEAVKKFNAEKSENLERISEEGQSCSKDVIASLEKEIEEIRQNKAAALETAERIKAEAVNAREALRERPKFEATEAGKAFIERIRAIEGRLADIDSDLAERAKAINEKLAEVEQETKKADAEFLNITMVSRQDERISELSRRQKELSAKHEELERGMHLCELFRRRKAELLDSRVNSRFRTLKFRLFIEQVNGGIKDDCEALIPCGESLVPFKTANNASRINAGLEVIDALSEYYGIEIPVWIDNAESNTSIEETRGQQIRLYVSEGDKELRCV